MDEQLVPIGTFSKATRLSVKALRHYDDIGLLRPARVDPDSGYRYYRLGQANQAEVVRILRGLDMPLDDIAEVLASVDDAERVRKTLDAHRARLADDLAKQTRMLAFLDRLLTNQEELMPYPITVEEVPDQPIASIRLHTSIEEMPGQLPATFGTIFQAIGSSGGAPSGPPLIVYHDVIDEDTPGDIEVAIPCASSADAIGEVGFGTLAGGAVAVTTHTGPYEQIARAYHALTNWMAEHGHVAGGPPREIYLNDPTEVDEADLLTRVEWPLAEA